MNKFTHCVNVRSHVGQVVSGLRFASREAAEAALVAYEEAAKKADRFSANDFSPTVRLIDDNRTEIVVDLRHSGAVELVDIAAIHAQQEEGLAREAALIERFPHLAVKGP